MGSKHIHAYINIAGSHLGVPKAASALLSGEMSDTVVMGTAGSMLEQFFGRSLRKDLISTWGSVWGMLPLGGDKIWGVGADICTKISDKNSNYNVCGRDIAENDSEKELGNHDYLPLFVMNDETNPVEQKKLKALEESDTNMSVNNKVDAIYSTGRSHGQAQLNATVEEFLSRGQHTVNEMIDFLVKWGGGLGPSVMASRLYEDKVRSGKSQMSWQDPLSTPLPYAPNLQIYCLYGVGIDTERTFFYKQNSRDANSENITESWRNQVDLPVILDADYEQPKFNIRHGVRFTDGDGSVPLVSLGYTCVDAWKRPETGLNPSGTNVITREYRHHTEFSVDDPMRGGPASSDHVDILGNVEMTEDFLRIVSDYKPVKENRIVSNIETVSNEINNHPLGGPIPKKQKRRIF